MKFVNPYLLNFLWFLILVGFFLVYGILRRRKILDAFCSRQMLGNIFPGFDPKKRWTKAVFVILGAGFAIVALAGPQVGFKWEKVKQRGVDIMIALDCSKSMLAQDIQPNRLERAKREIIDLQQMMRSDRAGLVAFSGNAILQCPLTLDHKAFHIFLDVLEPGFLPMGGTNLDAAVKTCMTGFEEDSDTQKAIILITDGESTSGNIEKTVKELSEQGIKLFCIGVGNIDGAPIPDESGGFKKDDSGTIILSKVDEKGLERLALMTGGAYVRSVAGDMDLDVIYVDHILGTMERKTLVSGKRKVWENRYQWFLFPCVILMMIEFLILPAKRKKKSFLISVLVFISLLFVGDRNAMAQSVFSSVKQGIEAYENKKYEQAKKHFIDAQLEAPDEAKLYYNIGTAAYMNKDYEQARKNFEQASRSEDNELRKNARFNLANTDYRLGHLDESIKGYENILKEFPDDTQAKENLEFVKKKKLEQKQNKQNKNQDSDKKDSDKKDQDKKEKQDSTNNPKDNQQEQDKKEEQQGEDRNQDQAGNQNKQQNQNKKQDEEQQKSGRDDAGQQNRNAESDQKPSAPEAGKTGAQAAKMDKSKPMKPGENKNMDKMLNRLDDKPGSAMMPVYQGRRVEKDW